MKTDSLAPCLSRIFNVTDRWVITVSQSWQAVEQSGRKQKKKKKVKMWNKRLDEERRGRRLSASTLRMGQRGKRSKSGVFFLLFFTPSKLIFASHRFIVCAKSVKKRKKRELYHTLPLVFCDLCAFLRNCAVRWQMFLKNTGLKTSWGLIIRQPLQSDIQCFASKETLAHSIISFFSVLSAETRWADEGFRKVQREDVLVYYVREKLEVEPRGWL